MKDEPDFADLRLVRRTIWSWEGVRYAWRYEQSFRSWVWLNCVSSLGALVLDLTSIERALILALGLLTLAAELFNTAIEKAVDHISQERHPLAKAAKDAGSAAVVLTAMSAGVVWLVVLIG